MKWIIGVVTLVNLVVGWLTSKNRLIVQLAQMESQDAELKVKMDAALNQHYHLRVTQLQAERTALAGRIAGRRRALRLMGVRGL